MREPTANWNVLSWPEMDQLFASHLSEFTKINSGMHVALLGTTRGGKTTLATGGESQQGLLKHWEDCLVLDSTGDPGAISEYGKPLKKFGKIKGHMRLSVANSESESRSKIHSAISRAVAQGNIAIYADEIRQLADPGFFNLKKLFEHLWLFTAKRGVSVIGGTQAPRWVPSPLYDQSKAHFIFGMRDRRAMKRLAEISGDVDTLETVIPNLARYEFAYVGMDGDVSVSKFVIPTVRKEPRRAPTDPARFQVRKTRRA